MRIDKMSFENLVASEKAAATVRKYYEDKCAVYRQYGMTFPEEGTREFEEFQELSAKLSLINAIRLRIIDEMERKLLTIE